MTHEELLKRIGGYDEFGADYELVDALRAVVELHKPVIVLTDVSVCSHCESDKLTDPDGVVCSYPCPTIQAIEEVLK